MKPETVTLLLCFVVFAACQQFTGADDSRKQHATLKITNQERKTSVASYTDKVQWLKLFGLSEAERILGEAAYLKDSSFVRKKNAVVYSCAYFAKSMDEHSGKTGAVYFMIEDFMVEDSAKHLYAFFRNANELSGIETLKNLGDEAYFHTDTVNFVMIIARKKSKLLRLKVNKITSHTSLDAFNSVVRGIVSGL